MGAQVNKFGLSREIPSPTKRVIRQQCGFGCVVCGSGIYQYEHIDPEWHRAKEHSASRIALLCGTCHDYVTRRLWPKSKILKAREHPYCLRKGFSSARIDGPDLANEFVVTIGSCDFVRPRSILRVFGE